MNMIAVAVPHPLASETQADADLIDLSRDPGSAGSASRCGLRCRWR